MYHRLARETTSHRQYNLLHLVGINGALGCLKVLLSYPQFRTTSYLNALEAKDRTPLDWALKNGRTFCAEILMRRGAAMNDKVLNILHFIT